jgi:hypothetical protein
MPLNYPSDGRFDGLTGMEDSLRKLRQTINPLQNLGINDSLKQLVEMSTISKQLFPMQDWLAAIKPTFPDLTGLSSLKSLSTFSDQLADFRSLSSTLSISKQLAGQFSEWQQIQQQLTSNFSALADFQRAALSPWVLQAQSLQQMLAGLQVQLEELEPEEIDELSPTDHPELAWQADFSNLTQQLATFADTSTATAVTTAAEVAAMRSEIRTLTALAQQQMNYIEQTQVEAKSPFQVALRILNIIGYVWTLISIVAFISDRMPKVPATVPVLAVQEPSVASSNRPATQQEMRSLQMEANDSLFSLASRTNQVRTTTSQTHLWAKPQLKATGKGQLPKRTAVVVQQLRGKWALVVAQHPGRLPQQGWMFKKYLSKPNQ